MLVPVVLEIVLFLILKLFSDNQTKKVYALSQTGLLKVFKILQIEDKESLELFKESNVYSLRNRNIFIILLSNVLC